MFAQDNAINGAQRGNKVGFWDLLVEKWQDGDGLIGRLRSGLRFSTKGRFVVNVSPETPLVIRSANKVQIRSLCGRAWVTRRGDCLDYEVAPGKVIELDSSKSLVVNAVAGSARMVVTLS
ncbi:DUF2917 domain-containing protein [Desulfovibrio inopinatus]|uniref:DUF2917 domain-containing protein n=1 Tax=Desulfovibrio inopinatus TaxID=102109 RepID=UPI0004222B9B|nr:DUF2917 domain-containing protein [Desulfovibrio inopinatus]